jgi:zinc protease
VYLGYHIPAADPDNPDTAALGALAQALFGETSPLYRSLVLEEQKVVLLMAEAEAKRDPGEFTIVVRVRKPEDVAEVRKRIAGALAEAASSPVDATRLAAIKDHLRYAYAGSLESADAVAQAVGQAIATTGRPDAMNDLYAAYDRLTPADLQRVAGRYFAATNQTVVTLDSKKENSQ